MQPLVLPNPTLQTRRKITLARVAGVCFGVRRAIDIALQTRKERTGKLTVLGPLVHNKQVLHQLKSQGIDTAESVEEITEGSILLSAHGTAPQTLHLLNERDNPIIDVTCPYVTKVHRMARLLCEQGYPIIVVGDTGHTEVKGVMGTIAHYGGTAWLVSSAEQIESLPLGKRVGILSQTTQRAATYTSIVAEVCRRVADVRAMNTICGATDELQEAAVEMARQVEVVLVVGGKNSANTTRLRLLCEMQGVPAYHIETPDEIESHWLEGKEHIGITAGASTPDYQIEAVARAINDGTLPDNWHLHHPDE